MIGATPPFLCVEAPAGQGESLILPLRGANRLHIGADD